MGLDLLRKEGRRGNGREEQRREGRRKEGGGGLYVLWQIEIT